MIDVTGHAVDPVPGVFRFYPRLENARGPLLVAGDTEPDIDPFFRFWVGTCAPIEGKTDKSEQKENDPFFHILNLSGGKTPPLQNLVWEWLVPPQTSKHLFTGSRILQVARPTVRVPCAA